MATLIRDKFEAHKAEVNARFDQLKANEEELNRIFAEIYNMVGEVPIEVEDKYVSVARIFDTADEIPESFKGNNYVRTMRDEIVSLISYAVGCMFGRYSLDVDGLVLANQGDTVNEYLAKMPDPAHVSFMPVADNVLPITDDTYFENDICTLFERFLVAAYGAETLEENLRFVADALSPPPRATRARPCARTSRKSSSPTTVRRTRNARSTGCSTPARRAASAPFSTCTATSRISSPPAHRLRAPATGAPARPAGRHRRRPGRRERPSESRTRQRGKAAPHPADRAPHVRGEGSRARRPDDRHRPR